MPSPLPSLERQVSFLGTCFLHCCPQKWNLRWIHWLVGLRVPVPTLAAKEAGKLQVCLEDLLSRSPAPRNLLPTSLWYLPCLSLVLDPLLPRLPVFLFLISVEHFQLDALMEGVGLSTADFIFLVVFISGVFHFCCTFDLPGELLQWGCLTPP